MDNYRSVIVIGAGPAGLAAAIEAKKQGATDVLLIEREPRTGGILNQCIHDGFGVVRFNKSLTGPEYARVFMEEANRVGIEMLTGTMVIGITPDRRVTVVNPKGLKSYMAGAVVLAMGCRERTRGALSIPGTRPAGIFTAGVAQHFVNIKNIMIGKRIVILGSGDIGLIMARRLTLEGAKVVAVVEKLPYCGGLPRNYTQCLEDYGIPLLLSHTVTNIEGNERVRSVIVSRVDERGEAVPGTTQRMECDTMVLSVGLIPENEVSQDAGVSLDDITNGPVVDENLQTSIPGVFACGNVLQVHDLVDNVSFEGEQAGRAAAAFVTGKAGACGCSIPVRAGEGIRYVLPQFVSAKRDVTLSLRVCEPAENSRLLFRSGEKVLASVSRRRLNPAEMTRIEMKVSQLAGVERLEVAVAHG